MNKLLFLLTIFSSLYAEKILIVSDTFHQIGGVEVVLDQVIPRLEKRGYEVKHLCLEDVPNFPSPYPGMRTAHPIGLKSEIDQKIKAYKPDRILVILMGFLSHITGSYCYENKIPFSLFYSSNIPEICKENFFIPLWLSHYYLRHFFTKPVNILTPSRAAAEMIKGVVDKNKPVIAWHHGVNLDQFKIYSPEEKEAALQNTLLAGWKRPFYLYVGRLSKEKNLQTLLDLKLPGTKILLGFDSFAYTNEALRKEYPDIVFPGPKTGKDLVDYYALSDVFIFPSKIDTFGLVQVEALACGLPVVAYNRGGPKDIIPAGCGVGYLAETDQQLQQLAIKAWEDRRSGKMTAEECRARAEYFSWDHATDTLLEHLPKIRWD